MHPTLDFVTSRQEHVELADAINAMHPGAARFFDVPGIGHHIAAEASEQAAFDDSTPPSARPYYGATLKPIVDAWLDSLARRPLLLPKVL